MFGNQSFLFAFDNRGGENDSEQLGTFESRGGEMALNLSSTTTAATIPASDEVDLYPIAWIVPITVVYGVIFIFGLVGNVSTCIVIARNKSLHTVTNYYLFSIAISDLLLLISGLPPEMYRIWSPRIYVFGEAFCILQGFASEISANATVLTITAFTVERYLAICHPFLSHTVSNLSRAVKYILAIWIGALCLAAPQAIQFGVEVEHQHGVEVSRCTVVSRNSLFQHAFEISTFVMFVGPMTLITLLYILIAIKLNKSKMLRKQRASLASTATTTTTTAASVNGGGSVAGGEGLSRASRKAQAQNRVIKMLVAVVVAFFICWAPFHAQRLLAVYLNAASKEAQAMCFGIYIALMYISGVLYFLSAAVNPILYHIMSNRFRQAFKNTFYGMCSRSSKEKRERTYSVLSRCPPSLRHYQRSISDGVHGPLAATHHHSTKNAASSNGEHLYMMEYNNHRSKSLRQMRPQSKDTALFTTPAKIDCDVSAHDTSNVLQQARRPVRPENEERICLRNFLRFFNNNNRMNEPEVACKDLPSRGRELLPESEKLTTPHKCARLDRRDDDISNSSLQDCDDMEYSSSDLVKYMEEVNEDLGTNNT